MVLIFGTICIDRIRRIPHFPPMGGYVEVEEEFDLLGGEAANTAGALAAWGANVRLLGNASGEGQEGTLLRKLAQDKGLEVEWLPTAKKTPPTPICDVYVTPDGDRTMFGLHFGAMEEGLSLEPLESANADWFTAEPNMANLSREAVLIAQQKGMPCYLMDFVDEMAPVSPKSFWQSSTDWSGSRGNTQKNVAWVQSFVAKHGCFAILSDGPNGFVAGSPDLPVRHYPPYPAPIIVDTTGAGDMFRAGMLFGLDQNWPIGRCLQFASAAGCLKCRGLGATSDTPTVTEILHHISAHDDISRQYL